MTPSLTGKTILITSRAPNDLPEFCGAIIAALSR